MLLKSDFFFFFKKPEMIDEVKVRRQKSRCNYLFHHFYFLQINTFNLG